MGQIGHSFLRKHPLIRGCPLIGLSLIKTGFTVQRVPSHRSVPFRQVLLYRGCPLIGVSLLDRFYCIEGALSSECPLKTGFTVQRVSSHQSVP